MEYVLELQNIKKAYGESVVVNDVSLSVKPGEIYALLGENGAGKSTLMNILFGMSVIHETGGYEGVIKIAGEEVKFTCPNDALAAGIGMVHQEFMLIPGFQVSENIKLGREDTLPTLVSRVFGKDLEKLNWEKMNQDARRSLDAIGMTNIEEHTRVAGMPIGYMQFVEIAREIDKEGIKLLVFDEPTAVLTESEAEQLLEVMRSIAKKGIAIIFITHRLSEVMEVADTMTIMRDGEAVSSKSIADTDVVEIAELMVGRAIDKLEIGQGNKGPDEDAEIVVRVNDLHVEMPGERVKGANFEVRKGEIFGIGGLAGQGKIGIANGFAGLYETDGTVEIFGEKLEMSKLGDALSKGVAFVSEDRRGIGLLLEESITHNIIFRAMRIKGSFLANFGAKLLSGGAANRHANEMIRTLDIRCRSFRQKVGTLSGGNQQKVCLASALTMKPRLLIVSEPTRGIDIGAKELILNYIAKLREEEGMTVIMISSELGELRSICDRIAIVSEGIIVDTLAPDAPDADYGLAMSAVTNVDEVMAKAENSEVEPEATQEVPAEEPTGGDGQ